MSAIAVDLKVKHGFRFYESTIGKKVVMAVTGFILFGFVVGHLIGNLQVFGPPEKINNYAVMLRTVPAALWAARIVLLLSVVLHIVASIQLTKLKWDARPVKYQSKESVGSTYASRTMMWSGPIIAAFVIYHLLHFTFGWRAVSPHFDQHNVYNNIIYGFQFWPASLFYIVAMVLLGLHLYHGVWSMFQTLGVSHPRYTPWLRRLALAFALFVAGGNILIPAAVLTGYLKPVTGV